MYSDRIESLVTLYTISQDLGLIVDVIQAWEPTSGLQHDLMSRFGQRISLTAPVVG